MLIAGRSVYIKQRCGFTESVRTEHTVNFEYERLRQWIQKSVDCSGGAPLVTMMQTTDLRD